MKPHSAKRNTLPAIVEPLEARIAPATIHIGAVGAGLENTSDTEYREAPDPFDLEHTGPRPSPFNLISFVDTSTATDAISLAVDPLRTADGNNTFFLRLNAGDRVEHFSSSNSYKPLIIVKGGRAVAFFTDLNGNNEYDDNELTGISLGANATVEIDGAVNGDIVTNLNERRTPNVGDDTVDMNSLVSTQQGIANLKVLGGSVNGSVLSGGNILSLTITGNVNNVLAGSAATNTPFDFFTGSAGGEGSAGLLVPAGVAGAHIINAQIKSITDRLEAGRGGAGGRGGSLVNIQITEDTDGFQLLAGAGGLGDVTVHRPNGGDGGVVRSIFITGVADKTPNSTLGMVIKAGAGGDGINTGTGGIGGGLSRVFVGFEAVAGVVVTSGELGSDSVAISAGAGGAGKFGGAAGNVDTVQVRVRTADVAGEEIIVAGGLGGSSLSPGGVAGHGGAVVNVDIRNQVLSPNSDILVLGGNGGTTVGNSLGSGGGALDNLVLLGYDIQLVAGDGSDGRAGGLGGFVRNVKMLADEFILTQNIVINAGKGGNASAGNGGAGGAINNINVAQSDLAALLINTGIAGDGGTALGGVGGRGGSVANLAVADIDGEQAVIEGAAELRAGRGGDGTLGGGAGGNFVLVDIESHALSLNATAGTGGNGLGRGAGGAGGVLNTFNFLSTGQVGGFDVSGVVHAGSGGDGVGLRKAGGLGGSAFKVSLDFLGDASLFAGNGGNGQNTVGALIGGASGSGGSILSSGAFATNGSGEIRAGNAGVGGILPGNGGNVAGDSTITIIDGVPTPNLLVGLHSFKNVIVVAGNGSHGGVGGDIHNLTYGSTAQLLSPTPSGTILIQAGNGSAQGAIAGRGGSIDGVSGSVGSGANFPTTVLAGNGGGSATATASGNGGNITNVALSRGGGDGVIVRIQAGDGGDSPLARVGGLGGSVRVIDIDSIDNRTLVRSVGAGDGGDARVVGGTGGSLVSVHLRNHDLGERTGEAFGYNRMGGAFAGTGGAALRKGLSGNVVDLNANSIAAIVAGRGDVPVNILDGDGKTVATIVAGGSHAPDLAEVVTGTYVNGSDTELLTTRNLALVANSAFRLKFGVDETQQLAGGSTAEQVQTALNALPGIASAGGVDVAIVGNGGYKVTFKLNGQRVAITGVENVPTDGTELTRGATNNFIASEVTGGLQILPVTEFRSGQDPLATTETVPGVSAFTTSEINQAINGENEVQRLDLSNLSTFATGEFTLSFGADTTVPLPPSTIGLPSSAMAAQIATALNGLASITASGGVTVEDSAGLPRVFNITFLSGIDEAPVLGLAFVPETQRIELGTLSAFPTGKFALTFLGSTTTQIPVGATPAQVAAALNLLPTVNDPLLGVGGVTVASPILGTYDVTFNRIGNQFQIDGDGFVQETQTLTLGSFAGVSAGSFTVSFGDQTTAPIPPNATPAQVQTELNKLSGIVAVGNVTVTGGLQNTFSIVFGNAGEQPSLSSVGVQPEVQTLGLLAVTGVDTAEFTLHIDHFTKITQTKMGTELAVPTTTTREGIRRDVLLTTTSQGVTGANGASEVQFLDLAPVLTFAGPTGEFYLEFPGANGTQRTAFLPALATAAQIDTALEALPAIALLAPNPAVPGVFGGVTVIPDPNTAQAFTITFNVNGDQAQITGIGGFREVQTIDTGLTAVAPGGELFFTLGNTSTNPLTGKPTLAQVDAALETLPAVPGFAPPPATPPVVPPPGGVTVTAPVPAVPNRFIVTFNDFGDADPLIGHGGGTANHEVQRLDLSQFAASPNTTLTLSFANGLTATLPVAADGNTIQTALNALPTVKGIRTDNSGAVNVTTVSPNVFDIDFNIFSDQPALVGLLAKDGGTTVRLPFNVAPAAVKAALDAVSLTTTIVSNGATPGTFLVSYGEFGDQPLVTSVGYIHEKQKLDVYNTGSFQLSFSNASTPTLPANATAQQVSDALNALPTVLATGKPVTVTANTDSSYNVVFGADNDQLAFTGVQFENIAVTTATDGSGTAREIQFINAIKKGEFNALYYATTATFIGAIADLNEIDANVFKSFTDTNGNGLFDPGVDTLHVGTFVLGDIPIDGLVMAKRFDQVRNNVIPEAKLTAAGFFDNDNII